MALADTQKDGRYDVIIFPNGGKECIGREDAVPPVDELYYLGEISKFVQSHQNLSTPTKYTGYYSAKNGVLTMMWVDYQGLTQAQVENEERMARGDFSVDDNTIDPEAWEPPANSDTTIVEDDSYDIEDIQNVVKNKEQQT